MRSTAPVPASPSTVVGGSPRPQPDPRRVATRERAGPTEALRDGAVRVVAHPEAPLGVLSAHTTTRRDFTPAETRFLARAAAALAAGLRRPLTVPPTTARSGTR